MFTFSEHPHRRYNPLTGQWVLVSPHRTMRPWQGKKENHSAPQRPTYDPGCYLCPGNTRANQVKNPLYTEPFVFKNDFSAMLPDTPAQENRDGLFRYSAVQGTCRVICFSPRHDVTLPLMTLTEIEQVVAVWQQQLRELGASYQWVQIFENKGEVMGCSNPHPHGQIWAGNYIPNEINIEAHQQSEYYLKNRSILLLDYLQHEMIKNERVIIENEHWLALTPFWALWPFETLLLPKRHVLRLHELTVSENKALAVILKSLLTKYDNLFEVSFPYTMGWHSAPFTAEDHSHWQLHAHFYPPLLRSATVKKFMVGYEMLAEPQRDLTAETAALRLRTLSDIHFSVTAP
jgi:UDPglucose--hexose-1-phosphate uridylyltransferase